MTVRESVPCSELATFKVGGPARYLIDCDTESDVREALAFAGERGLPWYPLGQGSNLLPSDAGYPGVLIRQNDGRISFEESTDGVTVIAETGGSWDALVREAGARGLWGIENLAGIPGTIGAAPVQNIGAYGAELADTLIWVEALDANTGETMRLAKDQCAFGYRESRFKKERTLIILRIALTLSKSPNPRLSYKDLAALVATGESLETPEAVASAVRRIRSRKFPDLAILGTAGSFFKNPVIGVDAYEALMKQYPGMPGFPGATGEVKVPLAWILDNVLSLRGFASGKAGLFEAQPLVIVAETGATASEINTLADDVAKKVFDATGIKLTREVQSIG